MASQPANTSISVHRTVRTYRQDLRHEAVKALTHKLRPLVFSVPGQETLIVVNGRTTAVTDFSTYMGEARVGATRGLPVSIGVRAAKDFNVVDHLVGADIEFPFEIGTDKFVADNATDSAYDLHQDLRDA